MNGRSLTKARLKAEAEAAGMEFYEIDPANPQLPPNDGKPRIVFGEDIDSYSPEVIEKLFAE